MLFLIIEFKIEPKLGLGGLCAHECFETRRENEREK